MRASGIASSRPDTLLAVYLTGETISPRSRFSELNCAFTLTSPDSQGFFGSASEIKSTLCLAVRARTFAWVCAILLCTAMSVLSDQVRNPGSRFTYDNARQINWDEMRILVRQGCHWELLAIVANFARGLRFFEIARVLVRRDHIPSFIVNAN